MSATAVSWGREKRHFKENTLCGEGIYIRRGFLFVAITAQMIGPAGIDTDKENIADFSNLSNI